MTSTLIVFAYYFFFGAAVVAFTLIFAGMAGFNEIEEEEETIVVPLGDANTMPLVGLPKQAQRSADKSLRDANKY